MKSEFSFLYFSSKQELWVGRIKELVLFNLTKVFYPYSQMRIFFINIVKFILSGFSTFSSMLMNMD